MLLEALNSWCEDNKLTVDHDKSKAVHFETETQCTYLGLLLTEHMNYNSMAKHVAKSVNRALGLAI